MIRRHETPAGAAVALAFMRMGLAARVGYFSVVGKEEKAAACRGSLVGLKIPPGDSARAPEPNFEVRFPSRSAQPDS